MASDEKSVFTMKKNKLTISPMEWAPHHFAWHLVDHTELSVKLEEIPAGGSSGLHYHKKSRQFFFVLQGQASIKLEDRQYLLQKQEGLEIQPNQKHQISNNANENLRFLLISSPGIQQDDILTCVSQ